MKLIIDRAKWLRGEDQGRLLRGSDGKMCCLGFYGLECGLTAAHIRNEGLPSDASPSLWPDWLVRHYGPDIEELDGWDDSADCELLASANDDRKLTEPEREARVAAIFAQHGVTVEFIG